MSETRIYQAKSSGGVMPHVTHYERIHTPIPLTDEETKKHVNRIVQREPHMTLLELAKKVNKPIFWILRYL